MLITMFRMMHQPARQGQDAVLIASHQQNAQRQPQHQRKRGGKDRHIKGLPRWQNRKLRYSYTGHLLYRYAGLAAHIGRSLLCLLHISGQLEQHGAVALAAQIAGIGAEHRHQNAFFSAARLATKGLAVDEPLKVTRTTWSSGAKLDRSRAALPPLGATRRFAAGRFGVREDFLHGAPVPPPHAAVQNGDGVADLFHDAHLMGDDHNGDAQLLLMSLMRVRIAWVVLGVQCTGSFVAQQNFGVGGQCAGNGDALLLTAGQLCRVGVGLIRQTHHSSSSLARFSASAFFTPASSMGKQTFFRQVRCISRLNCWKIMVMSRRRLRSWAAGTGSPSPRRR